MTASVEKQPYAFDSKYQNGTKHTSCVTKSLLLYTIFFILSSSFHQYKKINPMLLLSYSHKMCKNPTKQTNTITNFLPFFITSDNRTPRNDHQESAPVQTPTCPAAAEPGQSSPAVQSSPCWNQAWLN